MALTDVEEFDQGWTVGDTIYFLNGDRFDGPWDAGRQVMHGQGVYYWRDGQKFEGSFMNGIKVRFICLFSGIRNFCLISLVAHRFGPVNFEYLLLLFQASAVEKIKTNIQYSKFDTSKSMSYQGH